MWRSLKIAFRAVRWGLAVAGALALILTAMIATPLVRPPELKSISETVGRVDRSTMPALQRFSARDGTELAYRRYPARATPVGKVAIVVHGSSGSSVAVHALADALAARGVETFAPDIRGHGGSGTRGDIGYLGQLEDDLGDLVAEVRRTAPALPIVLLGHSAGGGFALRAASAPIQDLFARTVLLSPYLGYDAPTNRENSGGWAAPDIPRILALGLLDRLLPCCEAVPALAFAVLPNSEKYVASTYSYRLLRNFATRSYKSDLTAAKHPVTLIAGADDELMLADKYADAVHAVAPTVDVKLIAGVNHMEIVSAPQAVGAIAEDVATR